MMLECPTCGFVVDSDSLWGPKICPKGLSNERLRELGLPEAEVPAHLKEIMPEMKSGGRICSTKLKPLKAKPEPTVTKMTVTYQKPAKKKAARKKR